MVFLFVVLMIAITASIEFSRIKNRYMSSLFTGQSLIAYGDSNNSFKIDEIDHVLTSVSDKFRNPISADFEEFSNNSDLGLEVAVELYPYLYLDEIEISDGIKIIIGPCEKGPWYKGLPGAVSCAHHKLLEGRHLLFVYLASCKL